MWDLLFKFIDGDTKYRRIKSQTTKPTSNVLTLVNNHLRKIEQLELFLQNFRKSHSVLTASKIIHS